MKMSDEQLHKKKISFELSPEADEILEAMAIRIGTTKSDVLKKSLKIVELAIQANKDKTDDVFRWVYESMRNENDANL